MDCSIPGFPVLQHLPEFAQTHVHWVGDAIQSSHPLSPSSPPALDLSQHQGLLQWISSLHQVAKVLELPLQHQSFQWIFRTHFPQDGLVWSPRCPRESQESSPTPQFKSINSLALSLLYDLYTTTGKTVARQKREMNLKLVSQNPWQAYKIGNNFRTIYATTRGEGNGNPLQYSCLESPMDRGAWWAAVHGVTQSWTRLKWLSSSSSMPLLARITFDCIWQTYLILLTKTTEVQVRTSTAVPGSCENPRPLLLVCSTLLDIPLRSRLSQPSLCPHSGSEHPFPFWTLPRSLTSNIPYISQVSLISKTHLTGWAVRNVVFYCREHCAQLTIRKSFNVSKRKEEGV